MLRPQAESKYQHTVETQPIRECGPKPNRAKLFGHSAIVNTPVLIASSVEGPKSASIARLWQIQPLRRVMCCLCRRGVRRRQGRPQSSQIVGMPVNSLAFNPQMKLPWLSTRSKGARQLFAAPLLALRSHLAILTIVNPTRWPC